ncbi:MAG TPA: DNA polymerase III subunit delta [Verrucomicrobiae bacterium]|nr:DNA polymerase III subunit delta [Verrucomicrobiae bacterium]
MVTVLTGENSFAWGRVLAARLEQFVAVHGDIAVERLDGESASLARIQESLQSSPFLAARKLVVLRNPSLNKQFIDNLEPTLTAIADTTDLVIVEPVIDKRSSYFKWLKKETDLQEFTELDELGLARWLVAATQEQGGELSAADARLLVGRVGASQQLLASELNKLLSYDPHITREAIELLTEPAPQSKVFDLLDAAFAGRAKQALEIYKDQRAQRVDPSQIIAMVAWQLKVLAIVKSAGSRRPSDIAREAKLSPYVVQKSESIAAWVTAARLKELINDLLVLDLRSKRERIDLDEALQNYLIKLAQ